MYRPTLMMFASILFVANPVLRDTTPELLPGIINTSPCSFHDGSQPDIVKWPGNIRRVEHTLDNQYQCMHVYLV